MKNINDFKDGTVFKLLCGQICFKMGNLLINLFNGIAYNINGYDNDLCYTKTSEASASLRIEAYLESNIKKGNEAIEEYFSYYFKDNTENVKWDWERYIPVLTDEEKACLKNILNLYKNSYEYDQLLVTRTCGAIVIEAQLVANITTPLVQLATTTDLPFNRLLAKRRYMLKELGIDKI